MFESFIVRLHIYSKTLDSGESVYNVNIEKTL
jgi:hypothetical protein